ncbi:MAG: secretin and TonB N-terminal domain-containing protein [Daejeonella sp.]
MKLVYLLLTIVFLNTYSVAYPQRVSYSGKNVPLKTVFSAIQKQTGYGFFYDPTLLTQAKAVTLDVKNVDLSSVLTVVFKNQPLEFSIENKTILVSKKKIANKSAALKPKSKPPTSKAKAAPIDSAEFTDLNVEKKADPEVVSTPQILSDSLAAKNKKPGTAGGNANAPQGKTVGESAGTAKEADAQSSQSVSNGFKSPGNASKSFSNGFASRENKKITFGFKGGMNNSRIYATASDGSKSGYIGTELYGGFFADTRMTAKLSLGTELIFSFTDSYHFIELPLHLKYNLSEKWNLMAGPKLDYIADGMSDFAYDNFKRVGISGEIGSQYQINQLFFAEVRYAYGVTPQINSQGFGFSDGYRNTLRLGLGINFNKNESVGRVSKESGPMRLRVGLNAGALLTSGYDIVVGGDLRIQKNISSTTAGMLTMGYNHYSLKSGFNETNIAYFPIKAGLKFFPAGRLYLAPEAGIAVGTKSEGYTYPFVYAAGIGTEIRNGFDISLRYEKMTGRIVDYLDEIKRPAQIALRIEYGFDLNSGKSKSGAFSAPKEEAAVTGRRNKSVFVELLGNGALISGNFDMRLKPDRNDGFGIRAGAGLSGKYITVPLGLNYIVGKKRSGFETGIGITPAIYTGANPQDLIGDPNGSKRLDAAGFLSAGYRLQSTNGFMLRANAAVAFTRSYFVFAWPGLSLGYRFK